MAYQEFGYSWQNLSGTWYVHCQWVDRQAGEQKVSLPCDGAGNKITKEIARAFGCQELLQKVEEWEDGQF